MNKKMKKINNQQPSEFAGKIFINVDEHLASELKVGWL
jgi:hypothetical protein